MKGIKPQSTAFGILLKHLRIRAGLSQQALAERVGYSVALISRLESGQRLPDLQIVKDQFLPALAISDEPIISSRLLHLAAEARGERPTHTANGATTFEDAVDLRRRNALYSPTALIGRDRELLQLTRLLDQHYGRLITLVGPSGIGKTVSYTHLTLPTILRV